jgi:hypothetical protein
MKTQFIIRFILVSLAILLAFCLGITRNDGNNDIISGKIDLSYKFRDKTKFYCDTIQVDSNNVPLKYNNSYFPVCIKKIWHDGKQEILYDIEATDSILRLFNEPLLYNKELNKEVYRFVWDGAFYLPLVIRIEKIKDKYTLYWKFLKLCNSKNKTKTVINSKVITKKEWARFIILLKKSFFWNLQSAVYSYGCDGAVWSLEGVDAKRYQFVARWSGYLILRRDDKINICNEYLINLTDLTNTQKTIILSYSKLRSMKICK